MRVKVIAKAGDAHFQDKTLSEGSFTSAESLATYIKYHLDMLKEAAKKHDSWGSLEIRVEY